MSTSRSRVFDSVLYAQCWEDPLIDRAAFRIHPEDVLFSITSGGCNVLAFLADAPRLIYSLDLNPHQNFLLELKMGAFAALTYEEMLEFIGVRPSMQRIRLYGNVREALRSETRDYWDDRQGEIDEGIINAGRYERYMRTLRRTLEILKGKKAIRELFEAGSEAERARIYQKRWNTPSWRIFTRIFLSRAFMSTLFTGEFFRYVEGSFSFGQHFAALTERALTARELRENYFASYILLGHYYDEQHLPPYLMREEFESIRARLGRVKVVTGDCGSFFRSLPDDSIQKFNFSNIFEWMPPDAFEALLREATRVASDGAVLTYRNLLVLRERPKALADILVQERALAQRLHSQDRSFIYRNYVVERVHKGKKPCAMRLERSVTEAA